jgi:hemerythrin
MRKIEYPGYKAHREAHEALQTAFLALVKPAIIGTLAHDEFLATIQTVFFAHVESFDVSLVDWARQNGKI